MRFRPNKRASTDQAPGPIIAIATPNAARTICIDALLESKKMSDSSPAAMLKPAIGVQRPTIKSAEHMAVNTSKVSATGRFGVNGPAIS